MAINSINTNPSLFSSLRSLNSAQSSQASTQNNVSSGLRIAGALDNASTFAIAQGARGELRSLSALSQGLNNSAGAVTVGIAGATGLSNLATDIRAKLIELSDPALGTDGEALLRADLDSLLGQAQDLISNSSFNDTNLLESGAPDFTTLASLDGEVLTVGGQGAVGDAVSALQAASGGDPTSLLQNEFAAFEAAVNTAIGDLGASARRFAGQDNQLQDIADATEIGIGNAVDADLARESARLIAGQVRTQLAVQTTGIASQQSRSILGLFRS